MDPSWGQEPWGGSAWGGGGSSAELTDAFVSQEVLEVVYAPAQPVRNSQEVLEVVTGIPKSAGRVSQSVLEAVWAPQASLVTQEVVEVVFIPVTFARVSQGVFEAVTAVRAGGGKPALALSVDGNPLLVLTVE